MLAAGLAVVGFPAAALNLLHASDASAIILILNFGTAGLVLAADTVVGRAVLGGRPRRREVVQ